MRNRAAIREYVTGSLWVLPAAEDGLVFRDCVWALAAGMPAWLGCWDERHRERRFGGGFELAETTDRIANSGCLLSRGDARAALAKVRKLGRN